MSKLSFRARALDASKPMPIYMAEELPDLPDYSAINRSLPQMPSGMEKEEECVSRTFSLLPACFPCPPSYSQAHLRKQPADGTFLIIIMYRNSLYLLLNVIDNIIFYVIVILYTFIYLVTQLLSVVSFVYQTNEEIKIDVPTLLFNV